METEASAPIAKKRRTKEAPDEKQGRRRKRRQAPPPRPKPTSRKSKGNESVDHISSLPDAILGEIISLLSTKDGARTRILASRWRNLWLSAPLNLDLSSLPADKKVQVSVISKILASHPGPARRFFVRHQAAKADAWLQSAALNNLQELELHLLPASPLPSSLYAKRRPPPLLPAYAFRFSATLQAVTISYCHIMDGMVEKILDGTVEKIHFPQLRQLGLDGVIISDGSLHSIIAGSPRLEHLLFRGCDGLVCPRINSPSLRGICVTGGKLIIEDAPSLETLIDLTGGGWLDVLVISAPRLETLGCLSDGCSDSKLVFGTTKIQESGVFYIASKVM
ncbi:unnamed protein product [Urochloa decumbens]|uniref:F-box domain-containing protein n=1 Tax=Urochloa decumbens TaxID=240449 RepID=A0ABC9DWL1_9POAL